MVILPEVGQREVLGTCNESRYFQVGIMVTASVDKKIMLWRGGVSTHTISGHTGGVTCLAVISSSSFLSASEDGSVRRWSSGGESLGCYSGGDSPINRISVLEHGGWLTSGQDPVLQVWMDNAVVQAIQIPANRVVSSTSLTNGDVTALSTDGCVWKAVCNQPTRVRELVNRKGDTFQG